MKKPWAAISIIIVLQSLSSYLPAVEEKGLAGEIKTAPVVEEAIQKIRQEFESLRLKEEDFKLTTGWDLPLSIKTVEGLFEKPLDVPRLSSQWSDRVEEALTPGDLLQLARIILKDSFPSAAPVKPAGPATP